MTGMRGAALLLVLWLVALLTALVGAYALTARIEALQGRVGSRGAMAQEIARAGMEYALVRVADRNPETHWQPNGRAYAWRFDGHDVQVRIIDETGKVDLNQADVPLLSRLMQALGEPPDASDALAAAIVDWRDADDLSQPVGGAEDGDYAAAGRPYGAKDAPFETIAELEQVLGMRPVLYASAGSVRAAGTVPHPVLGTRATRCHLCAGAGAGGDGHGCHGVAGAARSGRRRGRPATRRHRQRHV